MKTEQQSTNQTPVIRLVDDDRELLDSLSFMLEMEDWKVRCFSNAREFLTQDVHSEPGCVILDVRMPGMTGLQLQQEMLARDIRLPIIFLSAHGDIDMAVDVMQSGAVTFLQKPVKTERLLQAIAGAVEADRKNHGTLPFQGPHQPHDRRALEHQRAHGRDAPRLDLPQASHQDRLRAHDLLQTHADLAAGECL